MKKEITPHRLGLAAWIPASLQQDYTTTWKKSVKYVFFSSFFWAVAVFCLIIIFPHRFFAYIFNNEGFVFKMYALQR